jgi:AcrR family transcriptional regulator
MQPQEGKRKLMDKRTEIRKCAKALFSANGFKNTNVSDITKMAGIAAGTFYLYYSSKDKLFMEIYLEENAKLKKATLKTVDPDGDPASVIRQLLQKNLEGITSNPILREWYNKDVFNKIEQNYREENGIEHLDFLYDSFIEIVEKWQAEGKMRADIDSVMIMAIFAAIINVDTHKEEIGLQYFPDVQNYLSDFVLKGLTDCSSQIYPRQEKEGKNEVGK